MKNLFKMKKIALLMILAIVGLSCNNDDDPVVTPVDNTITGIASRNADLSILVAALVKTDLAATLKTTGPFTVFAPTNSAFTALNISVASINASTPAQVADLKNILLNHVVNGSLQSTALTTGYVKTSANYGTTMSKISLFINTALGVKLNGVSSVTTPNVLASNGVVHVVDKVILLPTIKDAAIANPGTFSTLTSLLTRTGQPDFAAVLNGTTGAPYTVFAPTNTAFTDLNTELAPGGIASVSAANITKVLEYHVVGGANVLAGTLTEGQPITTILTPVQALTVQLTGGAKLKDIRNRLNPIIVTDVQCSNGVIHALSKVMLPNF